jgi:hypothetical protein
MTTRQQYKNLLSISLLDTNTLNMIQSICIDVERESDRLDAIIAAASAEKAPYVKAKVDAINADFDALLVRIHNMLNTNEDMQVIYDTIDPIFDDINTLTTYL